MIHTFAPSSHAPTRPFCDSTTRLKHSLWNDICQQPTLAANRPHYAKRVSDSTTQLQQCIQNVLNVLNERAVVLTRCANFAAALRDATAMQELSPLSPLGYLREAAIYSEQGRQQAVIDISNEGLSVVDITDPGYSKLEEVKMVAMQRVTCRIDFIGQLPLDVVTDVLFPMLLGDDDGTLDGKKPCPYLDVSKRWLDRAIEAGGGGLHFNIASENTYDELIRFAQHTKAIHGTIHAGVGGLHFNVANQNAYAEVIRHAQHTKSIRIELYQQGNWLSELFHRANLCFLRELTIQGLDEYSTDADHLVSSLKSVGSTLTHLTFTTTSRMLMLQMIRLGRPGLPERPLRVADILINCPHLVMLHIDYPFDTDFSAIPLTKTWPQLTTLRMDYYNGVTLNGQFLAILKRFPSLKKLVLHRCIETQPMTMIQRYCPSMRDLQLRIKHTESSSSSSSPSSERFEQQHQEQWMRGHRGGLEKISISQDSRSGDAWMDMGKVLQQHHNTLVHLELSLDYAGNNDDDLFNLEFPCLKTLALQCHGSDNACFGWWIMGKAPFLEELSITTWAIASHPTVLDIIPPCTLRKLDINLLGIKEPTTIERYLNQFAQQKEWPSLKELKIHCDFDGDIPATIVASICSLKSLQHLAISSSRLTRLSGLDHFTKMLAEGCPLLLSLELKDNMPPSSHVIKPLKGLQHLRHLAFHMDCSDNYTDLWDAFRTLSQLKSIRLFSMRDRVNHKFIEYLKDQRPDIKVVTPR